ncbi:APC family permease [Lichenicola sp.]|uniref:APC family permease n=1 Tax=Lichenicola sp. TaxID=2804529 RepID=UPI003B0035AA
MTLQLERDAVLRRHIGPVALAAAVINGVVGAGIFTLPAAMARAAGAWAPLSYLVCAIAMSFVVVCFAEAGSRLPTSGGVYGTVAFAFGPAAGFVCGMLTWMASVLACGGIAGALADTVGTVLPGIAAGPGRALVIIVSIGAIAFVNMRGVREAAWMVTAATLVKLVPLLLFVAVGAVMVLSGSVPPPRPITAPHVFGLATAVLLGVFAFSGMETPLAASGEVANGNRTVPRALFGAMGFVLVLYVAIQLVAQSLLGASLGGQAAPLAAAAARIGPVARMLLVVGAALSMLGWIGSDILGAPRILFAFARDGLLPRVLGRAHRRTHAPDAAIVVHAVIAAGLALSGSFTGLVVASTLNTAGLYFLGCGAAWVLHRRRIQTVGEPVDFRLLPVAAAGGMVAMAVLIYVAPPAEILGLVGVLAASIALYGIMRGIGGRARPPVG